MSFEKNPNASKRIASVDGLRALAVMGVLWAHVWAMCGNPAVLLGHCGSVGLDLHRLISLVGTGVDLFFVISGFCMYLMYIHRQTRLDWGSYWIFIQRRWWRLAPAFYTAAVVCAVGIWLGGGAFPWRAILTHVSFTHIIVTNSGALAAPFWSLATEWHFYLLLPFFLWASARWGFGWMLAFMMLASVGFRIWMYENASWAIGPWKSQLPPRLIEFCWGILIARWVVTGRPLPQLLQGNVGFLVGLLVAYIGRMLMTTEVVRWTAWAGVTAPVLAEPVLTLGYGLMLWNVVASPSWFADVLSHPASQAIGRWSYSLYLWQWWPSYLLAPLVVKHLGQTVGAQYLLLLVSLVIIVPLGWISYEWLEAPYFRKKPAGSPS